MVGSLPISLPESKRHGDRRGTTTLGYSGRSASSVGGVAGWPTKARDCGGKPYFFKLALYQTGI